MLSIWQCNTKSVSSPLKVFVRYATKRVSGSKTSNKDSIGRRLGLKLGESEKCKAGQIIYRQRGTKFYPGENAGIGKDHTIFALEPGYVRYYVDPFHPKRRFAGVALTKDARLPTPHFEPRRRRLGHVPIENPRIAEEERTWASRKETLLSPAMTEQFEERARRRKELAAQYQKQLKEFAQETDFSFEKAADRLVEISRYILGNGQGYDQVKKFVDQDRIQEITLSKETGRASEQEAETELADYNALCQAMDSKVTLIRTKLAKYYTPEELATMKTTTLEEITALLKDKEQPLSSELREKVQEMLDRPCFSHFERRLNIRKFLPRPRPVRLSEDFTLDDMKARVEKGEGKIVPTWNYDERKVEKIFLPTGGSERFII